MAHASDTDDYAYAWPIEATGGGPAWQVELTPEVYATVTSADLRDVAVVNANGEAVPTARAPPPANRVAWTIESVFVPQFDLPATPSDGPAANDSIRLAIERGADGKLRRVDAGVNALGAEPYAKAAKPDLLLDASALKVPIAALRVDWTGDDDVVAEFAVDASDDLQQWRRLVARATVLHLTRDGNALSRHDIPLNGANAAYLRVRRLDNGPALQRFSVQLRTNSVSTSYAVARQWLTAKVAGSDTKRLDASLPATDGQHAIAWRYQLPAPLAIDAIRLELADDNSLARVHVLSRQRPGGDAAAWAQRADFVAFRLRQDGSAIGNDESPATTVARASEWRIESTTPLERAPTLSLGYQPDRFVFLAQGSGPYRLVAGSAVARRGDYPVDAALASLRAGKDKDWQPPLATLAARATLKGDAALVAPVVEKPRDWKTWLLWGVLVGAAALIGGLALSLLRGPKAGA
jgi:hypothetical protein